MKSSRFLGRQQVLSDASEEEVSAMLDQCHVFAAHVSGLTVQEATHLKELALSLKHPRASTQADVAIMASQEADGRYASRVELLGRLQKRGRESGPRGPTDVEFSSIDVSDSEGEDDEEEDEDTLVETQSDDSGSEVSVSLTRAIAVVAGRERAATLQRAMPVELVEPDNTVMPTDEQELLLQSVTWQHMAAASRLSALADEEAMSAGEAPDSEEDVQDVDEPDSGTPDGELATQAAMAKKRKSETILLM